MTTASTTAENLMVQIIETVKTKKPTNKDSEKIKDLERNKEDGKDQFLTTDQGTKINRRSISLSI